MNKGRMTLTEALSDSGGPNQTLSDPARIFVFRGGLGKPEIYHLDAKSPDALILADRFPLQPRDVVYVDRAEGIRWNQIIGQVQPTVDLANSFKVLGEMSWFDSLGLLIHAKILSGPRVSTQYSRTLKI